MMVDADNLLIVLSSFLLVFSSAEYLYQKKIPIYVTRKIVHIGGGIVSALLPYFVSLEVVMIMGLGFFIILLISMHNNVLNSIHDKNNDGIGALLFAPGIAFTALLFWKTNPLIFQGASLSLGLSDGVAALVGIRFGKKTYTITGTKTVEGSLAFFIVTIFIFLGTLYLSETSVTYVSALITCGGAMFLTLIEAAFGGGWDNLFIPITAGTILYIVL